MRKAYELIDYCWDELYFQIFPSSSKKREQIIRLTTELIIYFMSDEKEKFNLEVNKILRKYKVPTNKYINIIQTVHKDFQTKRKKIGIKSLGTANQIKMLRKESKLFIDQKPLDKAILSLEGLS